MSSNKERKKLLTDKQQAIVDIVVTALEALVVVVCIVVSVLVWVGVSDPAERTVNWFAIQTDSMMGGNADSLNPGDMMFTRRPKSINDLKATERDANGNIISLGDVVAFKTSVYDTAKGVWLENQIITHRIESIDYDNKSIVTRGDNAPDNDNGNKHFADIIGVYTGKAKGLGKVTLWLGGFKKVVTDEAKYNDPSQLGGYGYEQSGSTATFLVIIIPLALLFVYNGYVVVKWAMDERAKKIRAAALAEAEQNARSAEEAARDSMVQFMRANGMTDEQIEAFFAQQAAVKAAEAAKAEEEAAETAEADGDVTAEAPRQADPTDTDPTDTDTNA